MGKRKLKKQVVIGLYAILFIAVLGTIYLIDGAFNQRHFNDDDKFTYVSKTIFDDVLPVVAEDKTIIRPYTDSSVKAVKGYYDYKGEAESQQNALIYNENTYLQNSGVDYAGDKDFDVVSILDGTVIDVKEDPLLGKIVEIRHSNEMISVYQSLSEIIVKKDDIVPQGTRLGKSGTCNISKELNSHLHFELIIKGQNVNPLEYFDKKVNEL